MEDTRPLDRKPAWNLFGLAARPEVRLAASGATREGLESDPASVFSRYDGIAGGCNSAFDGVLVASGEDSIFCGVFAKSANVPSSVSSSRQRTDLLDGDFFLTGVNETPFLWAPAFRRRGEAFIGEANASCWASDMATKAGAATGLTCTLESFLRFGVPRFDGENLSTGITDPSGLTM